jgi:hypothetical protein
LASYEEVKHNIQHKLDHYQKKKFMDEWEIAQLASKGVANVLKIAQIATEKAVAVAAATPDIKVGSPTSVGATYGGTHLVSIGKQAAKVLKYSADLNNYAGYMIALMGKYKKREKENTYQAEVAGIELKQIEHQILSAQIRLDMAKKDLRNHHIQIANSQQTDEFMRSKYTNKELYDWMVGQLSTIYFQSYQLAYELAKKTETAYKHELGVDDASFVQVGYWDSLKKGLFSAEKLQYDLRRMESAYYDKNKRDYEITKHVSLSQLDNDALIELILHGLCDFKIPEIQYDLDHPGHYFRRIKSVSISILCDAGPYTSVSAKLSLIKSRYRKNKDLNNNNSYEETTGDQRFTHTNTLQSIAIATSNAQNDSGVFELNFNDDRYLPFENAGAISEWRLELTGNPKPENISDVILHMKYTSKDGGETLKGAANDNLKEILNAVNTEENPPIN